MWSRMYQNSLTIFLFIGVTLSNFAQFTVARAESDPMPGPVSLTAPANDDLANAQLLPLLGGSATGTTAGATKEAGEPAHAKNRGGNSVWYKYVATGNSVLNVNTTGSSFDTTLAVYKGSAINNLKLLAQNDDTSPTVTSSVNVATQNGDVFYIAVDGYYNLTSSVVATGSVQINYSVANVAGNDNFANAQTLTFTAGRFITVSNVGASKESGEPSFAGNSGGKSVWFKWVAPAGGPKGMTFTFESMNLAGTGPAKILAGIFTGNQVNTLTVEEVGSRQGLLEIPIRPSAGTTYYIVVDGYDSGVGAETGTFTISYGPTKNGKGADFDRDNRADLAVFRPSTGAWYSLDSITDQLRSAQFGANGDKPMLMDLGRDGKLDYTIFRGDTGYWYVLDSETGFNAYPWGMSGDIPVIEHSTLFNWNSLISFRPTTGMWWSLSYGFGSGYGYPWGTNGDVPITADFYGIGWDQQLVFRPSNGTWYKLTHGAPETPVKFGQIGDKPVPADYDGDGVDDYAVFRPSTGVWYIQYSSSGSVAGFQWGVSGDVPQPADYDGDRKADIAVFRNGTWFIRQSASQTLRAVQFGLAGDIPVTAPIY